MARPAGVRSPAVAGTFAPGSRADPRVGSNSAARHHRATFSVVSGDGAQRWSGAAGAAGPDGTPLRPDTPFFIASVTKRFIATLVLQAHERGELDLDESIVAHLPPAATDGLHVIKGVEHTPHFPPQDLSADRQRARYSDTGFQLLIAILEAATGRSFATLLSERIITPLGLDRTWLPSRLEPAGAVAAPAMVSAKDQPRDLPQMLVASNDLFSTSGDLLRFQQALLAGELFDRPGTTEVLTERANLLRNMIPIRYGVGTMLLRVGRLYGPGRRPAMVVGHSGVTGSWLFHCPELDVHLAGTIDQAEGGECTVSAHGTDLRAWHG